MVIGIDICVVVVLNKLIVMKVFVMPSLPYSKTLEVTFALELAKVRHK